MQQRKLTNVMCVTGAWCRQDVPLTTRATATKQCRKYHLHLSAQTITNG